MRALRALVLVCFVALSVPASAGLLLSDVNHDGSVNILDLIAVRNAVGQDPAETGSAADVNGDGKINIIDLIVVRNNIGAEKNSDTTDLAGVANGIDEMAGSTVAPLPISSCDDYFPLQVGNWWEYEVIRHGTVVNRYRVEVLRRVYSYHYFSFYAVAKYFPNIPPAERLLCRTYANTVLEWPLDQRCPNLLYRLGASAGSTWTFVLDGGEPCYSPLSATIGSRSEKVSVPAGDFGRCIWIVYGHACSDAGLEAEWFAPGVGLVKRVETTFAGPVETVLTQACVNGEIIPGLHLPDGFGVLVKSDAPSYVNNLMPPGRILPVLTATLVVFNYGEIPATFGFSSSQRFDFVIRDEENGWEVYRWSADKAFLTVMGEVTLLNDKMVFTVRIPLEDPRAASPLPMPLPDGYYTLEGRLTSYNRPMVGTTTFAIKSVH